MTSGARINPAIIVHSLSSEKWRIGKVSLQYFLQKPQNVARIAVWVRSKFNDPFATPFGHPTRRHAYVELGGRVWFNYDSTDASA